MTWQGETGECAAAVGASCTESREEGIRRGTPIVRLVGLLVNVSKHHRFLTESEVRLILKGVVTPSFVTHTQRSLFAKGFIDLANIEAGALVFGQFVSDRPVDIVVIGLGITIAAVFYLGALSFSKENVTS